MLSTKIQELYFEVSALICHRSSARFFLFSAIFVFRLASALALLSWLSYSRDFCKSFVPGFVTLQNHLSFGHLACLNVQLLQAFGASPGLANNGRYLEVISELFGF